MKETCIRPFSFRPEDYHSMELYLYQMCADGWRLRWCKGTLAGFERTENRNLRYIVDPYAVSTPLNLKRFPKPRLSEYMENGWYAIGKSKGCYILCSEKPEAETPALEDNLPQAVQKTCRMSSLVLAVLLTILLVQCLRTPAVLYSILLTDIYIVLTGLVVFLILYHVLNSALLYATPPAPSAQNCCKRYFLHDIMLFLLLLLAIVLQARHQSEMVRYLFLPIGVVIIGSLILWLVSKRAKDARDSNKRLLPLVCIMGLVLLIVIPLSVQRLQQNSAAGAQGRQAELLAEVDRLNVLQLSDFLEASQAVNAIRENDSILGNNILYAEEYGEYAIFTNRTQMAAPVLAQPIFQYLYQQAQLDYQESFQQMEYNGFTYYSLPTANTYLLQKDSTVYFCTVPEAVTHEMVLDRILSF